MIYFSVAFFRQALIHTYCLTQTNNNNDLCDPGARNTLLKTAAVIPKQLQLIFHCSLLALQYEAGEKHFCWLNLAFHLLSNQIGYNIFCSGMLPWYTGNIFLRIIETCVYVTQYNLNFHYAFLHMCLLIPLVRALLLLLCFAKASFCLRKDFFLSDIFLYNFTEFFFYRCWSLITESL